jgi:hypothetical protein
MELVIRNYRCFSDAPTRVPLNAEKIGIVGLNNTGKSSILKFFYEFRNVFSILATPSPDLIMLLQRHSKPVSIPTGDPNQVFCNFNTRNLEIKVPLLKLEKPLAASPSLATIKADRDRAEFNLELEFDQAFNLGNTQIEFKEGGLLYSTQDRRSLLADLRNLPPVFQCLADTLFIGAFRNTINFGGTENYYDIKVGEYFFKQWASFAAGPNTKNRTRAVTVTNQIKEIFGFKEFQILPAQAQDALYVTINGKSYNLNELGTGLSQFILILINAAIRNPSYILIDEPELNLHPSLQVALLQALASHAKRGLLFATHNYGLARAEAEVLLVTEQDDQGVSKIIQHEAIQNLPELLSHLSFAGFREPGFKKLLLVEGPTDVSTIQVLLRKYKKEHEVVAIHLGGRSTINGARGKELTEYKRITEDVYALIDSERNSHNGDLLNERKEFIELCKIIGIPCTVLERRATENYLTDEAVKFVKGNNYNALGHYENLKKREQFGWSKSENWQIAKVMKKEDLDGTDLGDFLEAL